MDKGHWQETEGGAAFWWPGCIVPGCPNNICLAKAETRFCWPHSDSGKTLDEIISEATAAGPAIGRSNRLADPILTPPQEREGT
jgi:hypothetical protein